jgi:hypothetical protein
VIRAGRIMRKRYEKKSRPTDSAMIRLVGEPINIPIDKVLAAMNWEIRISLVFLIPAWKQIETIIGVKIYTTISFEVKNVTEEVKANMYRIS